MGLVQFIISLTREVEVPQPESDDGLWHDTSYFDGDDGLWHDAIYFDGDDGLWHDDIYF